MKTDDPQFTAHLLGEHDTLTPAERAEIEALLHDDPSAAAEAVETQKLAEVLRRDLEGEEMPLLTGEQRARVLSARASGAVFEVPKVAFFPRRTTVLSAIAACLIVGFFIGVALILNQRHNDAVRVATGNDFVAPPDIEMPMDANPGPDVLAEPAPAVRVLSDKVESPNVDVMSTTASASQFKVAPSVVVGASPNAGNLRIPDTVAVGRGNVNSGTLSGAMNGRMGSGRASAMSPGNAKTFRAGDATRATAKWEVQTEWARPLHRIDRPNEFQRYPGQPSVTLDGGSDQTEPGNPRSFDTITDNGFLPVRENPLSTFSTDVDTASYAIVRRLLNGHQLPPKGAVRIEEMLNYFTYDYPQPKGDAPFSATMEVAACPWTPAHRLVRIGLKGREIARDKRPASNLVFLIDVSGSMSAPNRLPLVKQSLGLLIDQLGEEDRVAMVVYAGNSGCVLDSTHNKAKMRAALARLEAGGSTNGASGIQLAYQIAQEHLIQGGTNRVILATDGDWNVGVTSQSALIEMITQKAKGGVFLTVLGFGLDNLNDSMLVKLAGKGNGNYAYIDTLLEAKKVLVDQLSSTLVTIAKDVKIQVEFNPAHVAAYRLIGYEKRLLAKEDFNDDKKDAGEIGAGHTVTALYEIVPAGNDVPQGKVDALKYQQPDDEKLKIENSKLKPSPELLTLKLRYKAPDGDVSKLLEFPLTDSGATLEKSSRDFRFAAAVAGYGMLLRDSPHKGNTTWNSVRELAVEGKGGDPAGYRAEFISLLEKAQGLMR